jgi:hypothetical protein
MNTKIINFDSCYANYLTDNNNTTTITSSPYYAQFALAHPIRNIKRIALLSVEIPLLFNNIRSSTNNYYALNYLSFTYAYNSVNYVFNAIIPENFYNNISSLLTAINSTIAADATLTSRSIQVVFSANSSNKIVVTTNSTYLQMNNTPANLGFNPRIAYPFMNLILGFNSVGENTSTGSLTAPNRYNLNVDNYINLQLLNFGNNQNINNINCSFKIPLNAVNGTIYYNFSNASYDQYIDNTDNNIILNALNVRLIDRFNQNINPNGGDYSFSLMIWYDN